ncbi:MAG: hypothetical protein ACKO1J_09160 [Tagaea sp.]
MEIVNGIPCLNCTDVERAKNAPTGDSNALNSNVSLDISRLTREFASANSPLGTGDRGRTVNLGV